MNQQQITAGVVEVHFEVREHHDGTFRVDASARDHWTGKIIATGGTYACDDLGTVENVVDGWLTQHYADRAESDQEASDPST